MNDLNLYIISPSSYGDDGRLSQYYTVLMQPPVFPVLKSLAQEAGNVLGVTMNISCINERLQKGEGYLDRIVAAQSSANINLAFVSAKTFELIDNRTAILTAPLPDRLNEFFPANLVTIQSLACKLFFNNILRGDAGMIGTRHP